MNAFCAKQSWKNLLLSSAQNFEQDSRRLNVLTTQERVSNALPDLCAEQQYET
tara:strand:- start:449 stop:607 length:159 start_codon:yes stop_codon:yes gene_type:complete